MQFADGMETTAQVTQTSGAEQTCFGKHIVKNSTSLPSPFGKLQVRRSQNSPNYRNTISAPALSRAKCSSRDVISTFSCCLLSAVSVLGNVTRHPLLFFMAKQHRSSFGLSRNILCQINSVVRQPSEINGELFSSAQLQK